ncbi:MAG: hypothetical protein RLZZ59_652 [Pseudomonadota bacterium]|jgi:ABC-type transporter Mla subunit MlaD
MPLSSLHQKQKNKNRALFALLVLMVVIFFATTIVKLSPGPDHPFKNVQYGKHR